LVLKLPLDLHGSRFPFRQNRLHHEPASCAMRPETRACRRDADGCAHGGVPGRAAIPDFLGETRSMAGFIYKNFEQELKKDNSHYERFKRSSLHDLVELLKRKMPPVTAAEVQKEMAKIPAAKWTKYANVKRYLTTAFNLQTLAAIATKPSVPGYRPGKWHRDKDKDGRWHHYVLQERGNSCGPACVAIVKRAV